MSAPPRPDPSGTAPPAAATVPQRDRTLDGVWMGMARLAPYRLLGAPSARFVVERNLLLWRGQWAMLLSGVFEPLLYLLVLGVGVGGLVGQLQVAGGASISYGQFVAPGLLGSAAMNAAVFETFNIYFKLYDNLYDAMGSTPADPRDIAIGEIVWAVMRTGVYAIGFVGVMLALGLITSPLGLLAIPMAMLVGFAFATTTLVATTYMRSWNDFDLLQILIVPLFLFSATFYPLDVLPGWAQAITVASPLYHGVAAIRQLTLGTVDGWLIVYVLVLAGIGWAGLEAGGRRFATLLRR
ncbi:MAG TPA: ABC transporter permease [Euzebya sp.]|nr:ABC transporter permease [Euzebya sp.]